MSLKTIHPNTLFVVDNENDLIIKNSCCFFTTDNCATYGVVWLEH